MAVKLLMLYPHPVDPEAFDRQYVAQHLPLMRRLLGPGVPLPTYKTVPRGDRQAPYYRVSEIAFPTQEAFDDFVRSGRSRIGAASARAVSTGGKPVALVCQSQDESPS